MSINALLAIDPGTTHSGYVVYDGNKIHEFGKTENEELLAWIKYSYKFVLIRAVIEEINPYTMGKTTRDTILWSGRFQEALEDQGTIVEYISRNTVRQTLCGSSGPKINDKVIRQALVDRFAYGEPNFGKGTKKKHGFFHGFKNDIWQAFALAVAYFDLIESENLTTNKTS